LKTSITIAVAITAIDGTIMAMAIDGTTTATAIDPITATAITVGGGRTIVVGGISRNARGSRNPETKPFGTGFPKYQMRTDLLKARL
jgi:hypothetical protein